MNRRATLSALVLSSVLATGCLPPAISDGKFYAYCPATTCPPDQIADVNASPVGFTDGTKLTDGVVAQPAPNSPTNTWYWGSDSPGQHPERDKWVEWGWGHNKVAVVVDLGKAYTLTHFSIDSTSFTPYGIAYPSEVSVFVSDTDPNPGPQSNTYSVTLPSFPEDCSSSCPESWLIPRTTVTAAVPTGTTVNGRYVKFRITTAGTQINTLVDEVTVRGAIDNPQRFVPAANQVYNGAYSVEPDTCGGGVACESQPGCSCGSVTPTFFGSLVGKPLATYIMYADWTSSYANSVQTLVTASSSRAMQLAWAPTLNGGPVYGGTDISLDAIIRGDYDQYLANWFGAAATHLDGLSVPLFMRFASEMNGDWAGYSGARNGGAGVGPAKYIATWRRVYNIAQLEGATNPGKVLFVWSPNDVSYPTQTWNQFSSYYPGHQYTEWVGMSLYNRDAQSSEPNTRITPIYNAYASVKPMMISEMGACPSFGAPGDALRDKSTFITHFFDQLETQYPRIFAINWFNYHKECDWRLEGAPANALGTYQTRIGAARYVSSIQGN